MGLDIELVKVLTKSEVSKLKKKHNVTDLIHPEQFCDELDKISFIEIKYLVNCDTNIETFNMFKHCLTEQEIRYYNVPAMLIKSKVKTKDENLGNYFITGYYPINTNYTKYQITKYQITHNSDKNDVIEINILDSEINNFDFKLKTVGFFIKDIRYIQRKGININKTLTGKCYNDDVYELFISNESQLEKLNENNEYKDCILKSGNFKIPKNHLLYINW